MLNQQQFEIIEYKTIILDNYFSFSLRDIFG